MNADPLAPLMFAVLFLLLFVGYPVAFVLGGVALIFGALALWADAVTEAYLLLLPERGAGIAHFAKERLPREPRPAIQALLQQLSS